MAVSFRFLVKKRPVKIQPRVVFSYMYVNNKSDNYVLHKPNGIEDYGSIRWPLFGVLLFTWVLIYLFVFKGTKSIGKVVYVTAIAPYIMLIGLLIRGCTLSGARKGIEYFLGLNGRGDWNMLMDIQVWVNATTQIFVSVGIGYGSLIAFSSFNRNNKTLLRDTIVIGVVNSFTSILSGLIIFSVLGHISEMIGKDSRCSSVTWRALMCSRQKVNLNMLIMDKRK